MEKLVVEKENRTTSLYLGGKRVLSDISFLLGWGDGIRPSDCRFVGRRVNKGKDAVGRFKRTILRYDYLGHEIGFVFKVYDQACAVHVGIENDLGRRHFWHQTGEVSIGVPGFKRGLCCSNSLEGLKKFPTSLREAKFFLVLLTEYLELAFKKPRMLARHLFWHYIEKDAKFAPWSYPKFLNALEDIPDHTLFLLLEAENPMAFAPVSGWGQKSSLACDGGLLKAKSWGFDSTKLYKKIPGVVIAMGDPYHATSLAFRVLKEVLGKNFLLRDEKPEARVFNKLGWCSWNAFYREFDGRDVVETIKGMREKLIPVRFVIIDDGWQRYESRMLKSFYPKAELDLKKIVGELKGLGVENVGLWHALQGYWMGIHPKSDLARFASVGSDGRLIPKRGFFERWYTEMERWGVSFVKVDNQFDLTPSFVDRTPIEEAASKAISNLNEAARGKLKTILNCMEVVPECCYNERTPTFRCSADYPPRSRDGTKKQLISCAYNSFWISNLGIPDFDTFQTHDPYAMTHAIARAISGGPIYLTDEPHKSEERIARMLCFDGGEIPQLDFPALLSPGSVFSDPYTTTYPLKLFTKFGRIGLVATFNLNKHGKAEKATICPGDAMLPEGEYAIYGVCKRKMAEGKMVLRLEELEAEVFVISPIVKGFAPIGLEQLLIPPAGIRILNFHPFFSSAEQSGIFLGYRKDRVPRVKVNGKRAEFSVLGKCLKLPVKKGDEITLR